MQLFPSRQPAGERALSPISAALSMPKAAHMRRHAPAAQQLSCGARRPAPRRSPRARLEFRVMTSRALPQRAARAADARRAPRVRAPQHAAEDPGLPRRAAGQFRTRRRHHHVAAPRAEGAHRALRGGALCSRPPRSPITASRRWLMDMQALPSDQDHVVTLFKQRGLWGAISKTNHAILRWRDPIYRTLARTGDVLCARILPAERQEIAAGLFAAVLARALCAQALGDRG